MRFILAILFSLMSLQVLSIPMESSPFHRQEDTRDIVTKVMVFSVCGNPNDMVPAAKALIDEYFSTEMLNSEFYRNFLWLEPEEERYASCVVCESGKPNDPYWEFNFNLWCQMDNADTPIFAEDPYEGEYSALAL